ncbi:MULTISPECIES: FMN-dependent NADH-azoreductase [Janthinobacterium]|uniref:FMN dependent NADH:quinone oxidoreductase n=1 Tax=Janthinobacterium lividum TaxID=29581 RepID=A0AAJ4MP15_9BURK|nr:MULTISPECIES: NAD(P)H-dependent oxidoreductase [Janthinobacterium]KAB0325379.1 FMN-dependent NADH-azoreductase [Janthinobacterium lividum]MCC7712553.1 NAD(P)H-dependent oxidoreductase [Janthinobacterium lividum]OEZ56389.1 FMN-dependent NADH-azoreductase 1 [Janthinobacterium lividum]QSX94471.1 NAD(P)H-dependent oxidoreductase [Janthinobacterium lividum]UGQ34257.1 NAD(P)H-dependent oxidoreductase [Janthinobacterium sp. PLB04]
MNILHIDSSILGEHSISRQLSAAIVARLQAAAPGATAQYRDLAAQPLPQFTAAPSAADGAVLAGALEQVLAADVIVIGAPMYNFAIPSQLKSWLDALAVPGKTFQYGANGPEGLLGSKRVIIASTRGGYYGADTPMAALEHQESHLRAFLGFLGVTQIEIVRAEGVKVSDAARAQALTGAFEQIGALQAA